MKPFDEIPILQLHMDNQQEEEEAPIEVPPKPTNSPLLPKDLEEKSWGKRYKAFEDLHSYIEVGNNDIMDAISTRWSIYLQDINIKVLEKAIIAFSSYIDKRRSIPKDTIHELIPILISKCVASTYSNIHESGISACVKLAGRLPDVNSIIQIAVEHIEKLKRCIAASVQIISSLLETYGTSQNNIKSLFPMFEQLLQSPNANLKKEILNFYRIAYKYLGNSMMQLLTTLPQGVFEEISNIIKSVSLNELLNQQSTSKSDIASICDNQWWNKYNTLSGWKFKKSYLEEAIRFLTINKIKAPIPKVFFEIVKKVLESEPCLAVVQLMIKIVGIISECLKEEMNGWKCIVLQLLQKYKEKKIEEEISMCLLKMKCCIKLTQILPQISEMLTKEKLKTNPNIKKSVSLWLGKQILHEGRNLKQSDVNIALAMMVGLIDDGLPEVREPALKTIGIIKVATKAKIDSIIDELSPNKKEIVNKIILELNKERNEEAQLAFSPSSNKSNRTPTEKLFNPNTQETEIEYSDFSWFDLNEYEEIDEEVAKEIKSNEPEAKEQGLIQIISIISKLNEAEINSNREQYEHLIIFMLKATTACIELCVVQKVIEAITLITQYIETSTKVGYFTIQFLITKWSKAEVKLACENGIMSIVDSLGPEKCIIFMISLAHGHKASPVCILTLISLLLDNYPIKLFPAQAIIYFSSSYVEKHYELGLAILSKIYVHVSTALLGFLYRIKEPICNKLIKDLEQSSMPMQAKLRPLKGEAARLDAVYVLNIVDKLLPPVDISSVANEYSDALFQPSTDSKVNALSQIKAILVQANMRIGGNNLDSLFKGVCSCLNESDDYVKIEAIRIMSLLISSIGIKIRHYSIQVLSSLICSLSSKNQDVVDEVHKTLTLFSYVVGGDSVINHLSTTLLKGCKELRFEALKWLSKENKGYESCEHKLLIPGIISCLRDDSMEVMELAEIVLSYVLPYIGKSSFILAANDIDEPTQEKITNIVNKVMESGPPNISAEFHISKSPLISTILNDDDEDINIFESPSPIQSEFTSQIRSHYQSIPKNEQAKVTSNLFNIKKDSQITKKTAAIKSITIQNPRATGKNSSPRGNKKILNTSNRSSDRLPRVLRKGNIGERINTSLSQSRLSLEIHHRNETGMYKPIIMAPKNKERRLDNERGQWPLVDSHEAYFEMLKKVFKPLLNVNLFRDMLINADFKIHIECISAFIDAIDSEYEDLLSILDLVLRWLSCGYVDNNMGINKSTVDFLLKLVNRLLEKEYFMLDIEVDALMPLIIKLLSSTNGYIKQTAKEIVERMAKITDIKYITPHLAKVLRMKNAKSKAECMQIASELIINYSTDIFSEKDINVIALSATTKEITLKTAVLNVLLEIYKREGIDSWNKIGAISDEVHKEINNKFQNYKPNYDDASESNTESNKSPPMLNDVRRNGVHSSFNKKPVQNKGANAKSPPLLQINKISHSKVLSCASDKVFSIPTRTKCTLII